MSANRRSDIVLAHCALAGRLRGLFMLGIHDLLDALYDAKGMVEQPDENALAARCSLATVFRGRTGVSALDTFPAAFVDALERAMLHQLKHASDACDGTSTTVVVLDDAQRVEALAVYWHDGAELPATARAAYDTAKRAVHDELGALQFDADHNTCTVDEARLLHRYSDAVLRFMDEAVALCANVLGKRHDDTRALANEARRVRRLRQLHDECCV
jgi:hypothetical protein